jgi:hypothetical protein
LLEWWYHIFLTCNNIEIAQNWTSKYMHLIEYVYYEIAEKAPWWQFEGSTILMNVVITTLWELLTKCQTHQLCHWINGKLRWLSTDFHHLQLMHTVRLIFQPITRRDSCSPHGGGANRAPISKASSGGASSRRSLSFIHLRYRRLLSCSYHIPHQLQTQIRQKQIRSSFLSWAKECNCNTLLHFFPSLSKAKRVPHWFWQISVRAQSMLWWSTPSNTYHHSSVVH